MQILLSAQNLQAAVLLFIQDRVNLAEDENISVELTEEGAVVNIIGPGEEESAAPAAGASSSSTLSGKPAGQRRPRRTKAQIEADEAAKAAAEAGQAQGGDTDKPTGDEGKDSTPTDSAPSAAASDTASSSDAGGETDAPVSPQPEQSSEPAVAVNAELQSATETPVGGEATPVAEEQPQEEAPAPKPTASLFANLRKPVNS